VFHFPRFRRRTRFTEVDMLEIEIVAGSGMACFRIRVGRGLVMLFLSLAGWKHWH
jgi:hypothetical protein